MLDMQLATIQEAPAEPITIDPDYPITALVAAVIIQAVRDAARGDLDAVEWLQWDGLLWAEAAGFDADEIIKKWILEGCKKPKLGSRAHKSTDTKCARGKSKRYKKWKV